MISELSLSGPNAHSAIELTIRLILSKAPPFKYVPRCGALSIERVNPTLVRDEGSPSVNGLDVQSPNLSVKV